MAAKALLFDLDGTLWDSYPCYAAALRAGAGVRPDSVVRQLMAGDNIVSLIGKLNLTKAQFTKHCLDEDTDLCLYPGVSKTLRALKDRGTPLGVVTNLPNWLVQALLKKSNLNSSFDTLVCAAGKPRPGGLARALSAMRRNADPDTFYVGDRPSDAEAAVNAGISFAWVSYGYGKKRPAGANVALAHFSEVLDL